MNNWFGALAPWLMVAGLWIGFGCLFAIALGLLARVGAWKERRGGK